MDPGRGSWGTQSSSCLAAQYCPSRKTLRLYTRTYASQMWAMFVFQWNSPDVLEPTSGVSVQHLRYSMQHSQLATGPFTAEVREAADV